MCASMVVPSGASIASIELPCIKRHATVQGQAASQRHLQQFLRLLAAGHRATFRAFAAAQFHWSGGPRQPLIQEGNVGYV